MRSPGMWEFCRNPRHVSPPFPQGYWPEGDAPADAQAWDRSVAAFRVDLRAKTLEDGRSYLDINPKGAVPALQLESGEVLTENAVVLQYLGDDAIKSAAENIAEITRKAFLLEVPTEWDFENTLSSRSDSNVHKRSKQFYLALFAPWFENYGGGLFIKKDFAFYPYDIWRF